MSTAKIQNVARLREKPRINFIIAYSGLICELHLGQKIVFLVSIHLSAMKLHTFDVQCQIMSFPIAIVLSFSFIKILLMFSYHVVEEV